MLKHRLTNYLCQQYRVVPKETKKAKSMVPSRIQSLTLPVATQQNDGLSAIRRAQSTSDMANIDNLQAGEHSLPSHLAVCFFAWCVLSVLCIQRLLAQIW